MQPSDYVFMVSPAGIAPEMVDQNRGIGRQGRCRGEANAVGSSGQKLNDPRLEAEGR